MYFSFFFSLFFEKKKKKLNYFYFLDLMHIFYNKTHIPTVFFGVSAIWLFFFFFCWRQTFVNRHLALLVLYTVGLFYFYLATGDLPFSIPKKLALYAFAFFTIFKNKERGEKKKKKKKKKGCLFDCHHNG